MKHTILALDTAGAICSVALQHQGKITYKIALNANKHAEEILPLIKELLDDKNLTIKNIDFIAVAKGPGSFTGVRVAIAVTQGLAFGANIPIIAISNLTLLAEIAWQEFQATEVLATIDARMNQIYATHLIKIEKGWQNLIPEILTTKEDLKQIQSQNIYLAGFIQELSQQSIATNITETNAKYMFDLANTAIANNQTISATALEPTYLQERIYQTVK